MFSNQRNLFSKVKIIRSKVLWLINFWEKGSLSMKRILCLLVILVMSFSTGIRVQASSINSQKSSFTSKPMKQMIEEDNIRISEFLNEELGIDGSENSPITIQPQWTYQEWFERFEPSLLQEKRDAYIAADVEFDTRGEAGTYTNYTVSITSARTMTQVAALTISATAEIKTAMFEKLQAAAAIQLSQSHTNYNEVGTSHTYQIYTNRTGYLKAYHKGYYTKGAIIYGYRDSDGSTGTYTKGNGNSYAPYSDNVVRVYFAAPIYR